MVFVPIKIVSFNTYLIAERFNNNRYVYPEQRAGQIQSFVKDKDLCFLQEVWGSGLSQLVNNDNRHATPPLRSPLFQGSGTFTELFHNMHLRLLQTGGLYDMAAPGITCTYRAKHTFTVSRSKSLKGVEATLWKIPQWGQMYSLLVLNTHLDPWHEPNRRQQVQEIAEFFQTTLETIQEQQQPQQQDWSRTGVLVVGDFNIKAGSEEYHKVLMKQEGRWKDYFDGLEPQQDTYALQNSLVSIPEDCGRIDYIFGIERFGNYQFLPLQCLSKSLQVHPQGQELSDHYPLILVAEFIPRIYYYGKTTLCRNDLRVIHSFILGRLRGVKTAFGFILAAKLGP
jgi:endonuclease/exonuclease/phosphatase family metal-dependent hydrolase